MQHVAEAEQTVEPVGALFNRPTRSFGRSAGRFDRKAFPRISEYGILLIQVSGDSVAGRYSPIAQPAARLDGARWQGEERRSDLRLGHARVIRRQSACRNANPTDKHAKGGQTPRYPSANHGEIVSVREGGTRSITSVPGECGSSSG